MVAPAVHYERLTRPASGLARASSLWLAHDHVLLVQSTGFQETYQRFYLRDIQCVMTAPSDRFAYFNLAGLVGLLIGGVSFAATLRGEPAFWPLFLLLPAMVVLAVNLLLGPSCRVQVTTSLQAAIWSPLSRRRRARNVLARLTPLIEAAQQDGVAAQPAEAVPAAPAP